jgi:hypothetical protein
VPVPPPISTEGGSTLFSPTIREQVQVVPQHQETDSTRLVPTALELTFSDPGSMLLQDLKPKCEEQGIIIPPGNNLPAVKQLVWEHFAALHSREGTHIFLSNCYFAKKQSIDRKRKMTSAQKRKSKFAAMVIPKSVPAST